MLNFSKDNRYRITVEKWTIDIASLWKLTIAEVLYQILAAEGSSPLDARLLRHFRFCHKRHRITQTCDILILHKRYNHRSYSNLSIYHIHHIEQTRSSWLNCALRDDEAVYWVSIGHYEAVAVGNRWYWVDREHLCHYILHKVEIWTGVTDAWLTHSLTDFER